MGLLGAWLSSSRAADSAGSVSPAASNKSTLAMRGRRSFGSASAALSSQLCAALSVALLQSELRQTKHGRNAIRRARDHFLVSPLRVSLATGLHVQRGQAERCRSKIRIKFQRLLQILTTAGQVFAREGDGCQQIRRQRIVGCALAKGASRLVSLVESTVTHQAHDQKCACSGRIRRRGNDAFKLTHGQFFVAGG